VLGIYISEEIMDGTRFEFPPETFDIAFSFSSIEHFEGENHEGALKSF
jgi:hypothetical protein